MDTETFKLIVENQDKWRKQYYENKLRKNVISVICGRKYKNRGNKNVKEIYDALVEMGYLEDAIYLNKFSGDICHEYLLGK